MIVPMKKIFVVVDEKDIWSAMEGLREAGVLHITHTVEPLGPSVNDVREAVQRLERSLDILIQQPRSATQQTVSDWDQQTRNILGLVEQKVRLEDQVSKRQGLIETWEPWGAFDPQDIRSFEQQGVFIRLVEIPKKDLVKLPDGMTFTGIFTRGRALCGVVAYRDKNIQGPFRVLTLPSMGLRRIKEEQAHDCEKIRAAENALKQAAAYTEHLKKILAKMRQELNAVQVYAGRGRQENFAFIEGFCPGDRLAQLENLARQQAWGLLTEDPDPEDPVPTLLRDPQWVEWVKPLFHWLNILPGYREMDISFIFLLFFSLFFGILIGDAGYGLVFFLATVGAHLTLRKKARDVRPFFLMYVLSTCTVVWGGLSGTFFGQAWLPALDLPPVVTWLRDIQNFQWLCFLLGTVHLSLAHLWRGARKMPALAAVSEVGWLMILWGMFFVANMLILERDFPPAAKGLFFMGPALVVLFSHPSKHILKTIGSGIGALLNNLVNSFTDIVSYIRLFAVSLATVAVADAFNQAAMGIGFDNLLAGFITALILVVGHVFNMALGAMSILVHGLRLNVLEFSSHLNLEWKGFPYQPFRKTEESNV